MLKNKLKGFKINNEFLADFIKSCIDVGLSSTKEFLERAENEIQTIDSKLIEAEILKKRRIELLSVIGSLKK